MKKLFFVFLLCLSCLANAQIRAAANREKFDPALLNELDKVERLRAEKGLSVLNAPRFITPHVIQLDSNLRLYLGVKGSLQKLKKYLHNIGCDIEWGEDGSYNVFIPYDRLDTVAELREVQKITFPAHNGQSVRRNGLNIHKTEP